MLRADNVTTCMCRLSWNLEGSTSWNPLGLTRPVYVLLYLLLSAKILIRTSVIVIYAMWKYRSEVEDDSFHCYCHSTVIIYWNVSICFINGLNEHMISDWVVQRDRSVARCGMRWRKVGLGCSGSYTHMCPVKHSSANQELSRTSPALLNISRTGRVALL